MAKLGSPTAAIAGSTVSPAFFTGRVRRRSNVNIQTLDDLYNFFSHLIIINSFFCITFKVKLSVIVKYGPKPNPGFPKYFFAH
jgi:hypothetical protein